MSFQPAPESATHRPRALGAPASSLRQASGSSTSAISSAGLIPPPPPTAKSTTDPILRNALRYTVSPREYAALHKYVLSRSKLLRKRAPSVAVVVASGAGGGGNGGIEGSRSGSRSGPVAAVACGTIDGDDFNVKAIRHALRVFVVGVLGLKGWDLISRKILKREPPSQPAQSTTLRLPLSLSLVLLLYRLLFRFLTRLRAHILTPTSAPFRERNPRATAALTSPYAPATGAALAGALLSVAPAGGFRAGAALWLAVRVLEWGWDLLEAEGRIWGMVRTAGGASVARARPWWFGSWLLQPFVFGQLLHAVVFDRDCVPNQISKLFVGASSTYLQPRPADLSSLLRWPRALEVVDDIAQMARLQWPLYISPTLFPNKPTLPASVRSIAPITAAAHPLITSLSCAAMHPADPSCLRTYLTFWLRSFPPLTRLFVVVYTLTTFLPALGKLYHAPFATIRTVLERALRTTTFATGALSTAWASICMFQAYLPRRFLSTQRFFLGGFLAGLWAFIERKRGRTVFLYSFKASLESLWRVGVKRRWWKGVRGGDVMVFMLALAVSGVVYERGGGDGWRKEVSWVRGTGWREWGVDGDESDGSGDGDDDDDDDER